MAIATQFFGTTTYGRPSLALASNFPDAIAGGLLSAAFDGPILLTQGIGDGDPTTANLETVVIDYLSGASPHQTGYILGGEAAIPADVASDFESALG